MKIAFVNFPDAVKAFLYAVCGGYKSQYGRYGFGHGHTCLYMILEDGYPIDTPADVHRVLSKAWGRMPGDYLSGMRAAESPLVATEQASGICLYENGIVEIPKEGSCFGSTFIPDELFRHVRRIER